MKRKSKKSKPHQTKPDTGDGSDSDASVGDIFTDEITEFTEARNKIDSDEDESESSGEEAIFRLDGDDDEDDSDEELGEWSKRLKQIKFQAKLEKKKIKPDAPEKSWGSKRNDFYGSGVKRKLKETGIEEEDEWLMEEREVEKLQKQLDEDVEEEDFLIPSLSTTTTSKKTQELTVKRNLTEKEEQERQKKLHPEAAPLREELNKCLEELEKLRDKKGWRVESKDTCFRLLAANIAFYLHLIESNEDCRGHPVLKRIVQWKKLAAMYEDLPEELLEASEEEEDSLPEGVQGPMKRPRIALSDSEEEGREEDIDASLTFGEEQLDSRPITYQMEKNKIDKKKSAPNNPRVKHREKFRKAQIRRRGQVRQYKPEINKYQGEASGIRAGIVRSVRFK